MSIKLVRAKLKDAILEECAFPYAVIRAERGALCSWDGTRFVCLHYTRAEQSASVINFGKVWGFGTYQWKGDMTAAIDYRTTFWGFERVHGDTALGCALFKQGGTAVYRVVQGWAGVTHETDLTAQDWTVETTFKIVWTSTSVEYYTNGALVSTETTDVPQEPQAFLFLEILTGVTAPASTEYYYAWDFQKLA